MGSDYATQLFYDYLYIINFFLGIPMIIFCLKMIKEENKRYWEEKKKVVIKND